MACLTLAGYSRGCDDSIGGIKKVALFEKSGLDLTGATIVSGVITILTQDNNYTGYTYDFLKWNSNWVEPILGDGLLANASWQPQLNLIFKKTSATLRNEIYELSKGETCAIVQDQNDEYWFLGFQNGLDLIASPGFSSGNVSTDPNGATILLQGLEAIPSYSIDISSESTVDARILALFGF